MPGATPLPDLAVIKVGHAWGIPLYERRLLRANLYGIAIKLTKILIVAALFSARNEPGHLA